MTDSRSRLGRWRARTTDRRFRLLLAVLAVLAAVVVFLVATTVFPHHSSNHDEGVYLQQAELLLDGQLWFTTAHPEAMQPWFFVRDGSRLYPKYTPVTAAIFALGFAVGIPRLALALVAAANVGLAGLVTREIFDERTGLLAAVLLGGSPLFLVDSSVFLSYAPTTACNLAFAFGYLRSWRTTDTTARRRYAVLAGVAIGVAFFSRPLTAILFAIPFVCHSLLAVGGTLSRGRDHRAVLERVGLVATFGTAGVVVALGYNAVVTGDPLVFPYQAFAPLDGPGFGYRRIRGYDRVYTPALALRANGIVLWRFATRWTTAAPLGTLAAAVGLGGFLWRVRDRLRSAARPGELLSTGRLGDTGARALLAGLFLTIPAGNVFFWGNLNILAALDEPTDGLIAQFGPFYHFDLLLPLAAFGAAGLWLAFDQCRDALAGRLQPGHRRVVLAAAVAGLIVLGGVTQASALSGPIDRTRPYTERYDRAYAPFENRSLDRALVFLPTTYGEWLNHPFQSLRNNPDLDGSRVYALDLNASSTFGVLDTYPERTPYRYAFRGEWRPAIEPDDGPITPALRRLRVETGRRHRIRTTVGRVAGAQSVSIRLASESNSALYGVERLPPESLTVEWVVTDGTVRPTGPNIQQFDDRNVTFEGTDEIVLTITFTQAGGSTVTYREELTVRERDGRVQVVWPPERQVCRLVTECGSEGTYIEGADDYVGGVSMSGRIQTVPARPDINHR